MRRWVHIYVKNRGQRAWVPDWFYGLLGLSAIRVVERKRQVGFENVERAARRMRQPLLMIHGGGDTYIKPEMAEAVFKIASKCQPRHLWIVDKAKHNQAIQLAGEDYHTRIVEFFDRHLANAGVVAARATSR